MVPLMWILWSKSAQIGHISVCNFYPNAITNNVSHPTFFNIFAWNSKLNLAVNYLLQFLNFGGIFSIDKYSYSAKLWTKNSLKISIGLKFWKEQILFWTLFPILDFLAGPGVQILLYPTFWGFCPTFVLLFGFCRTYPNFWDFPTFVLLFTFFHNFPTIGDLIFILILIVSTSPINIYFFTTFWYFLLLS